MAQFINTSVTRGGEIGMPLLAGFVKFRGGSVIRMNDGRILTIPRWQKDLRESALAWLKGLSEGDYAEVLAMMKPTIVAKMAEKALR